MDFSLDNTVSLNSLESLAPINNWNWRTNRVIHRYSLMKSMVRQCAKCRGSLRERKIWRTNTTREGSDAPNRGFSGRPLFAASIQIRSGHLAHIWRTFGAAKDCRWAACANSAPKGAVDLAQHKAAAHLSASPKPVFGAGIGAGLAQIVSRETPTTHAELCELRPRADPVPHDPEAAARNACVCLVCVAEEMVEF